MAHSTYINTPIVGYRDGYIDSDIRPLLEYTPSGDTEHYPNGVPNYWFYIDGMKYNVHPYSTTLSLNLDEIWEPGDLKGWPVRWFEVVGS